jgi:cobalamin biosynthesis protein CobD/CbiB
LRYGSRNEERPVLGDGPRPTSDDIERAIALADRVERAVIAVLAGFAAIVWSISRARPS